MIVFAAPCEFISTYWYLLQAQTRHTASLSPVERTLIESISPHIPIILLPPSSTPTASTQSHDRSRKASTSHLSSFRPASIDALRSGLFRTPSTLTTLRSEAASRFLRWREVERAVERVQWSTGALKTSIGLNPRPSMTRSQETERDDRWDKGAWEAQWEDSLSQEVALHLRRRRRSEPGRRLTPLSSFTTVSTHTPSITLMDSEDAEEDSIVSPCASAPFDPLHLPSLVVFSFSLLGALRTRVVRSLGWSTEAGPSRRRSPGSTPNDGQRKRPRSFGYTFGIGLALVSAFCAGVGIGLVATGRF